MPEPKKDTTKDHFIDSKKDDLLLSSFLAGDESAYTNIYKLYVDSLFAYGVGMGFDQSTIKDAIHDVFYKLYFNRKLLKNVTNPKYYLLRMLKNRLLDIYKTTIDTIDISEYEPKFSIKVTVLDQLIQEEDKNEIQCKLEKLLICLTDRQREAIYLRFMQELEYEEIARLLNMTPQAARKLIFRAMERMREQGLSILIFFSPAISFTTL